MGPLIDPELELVDKRILMLGELNNKLIDAFQLYHDIMAHQNAQTMNFGPPNPTAAINSSIGQIPSLNNGHGMPNTGVKYPYGEMITNHPMMMMMGPAPIPSEGNHVKVSFHLFIGRFFRK